MNPETERKYQRLRSFFFGLCVLASGLLFLITVENIIKTLDAETWPTHIGILEETGSTGWYAGTSLLRYSYEIDGKKYQGTRIGYGISNTGELQVENKSLKVFVNPSDQSDAVLVVGVKKMHLTGLLFSGGFLWLAFYIWRRTR